MVFSNILVSYLFMFVHFAEYIVKHSKGFLVIEVVYRFLKSSVVDEKQHTYSLI